MPAVLIMLLAVLVFTTSMVSMLFINLHWPTVLWTVFLISGYVLQVTALWKAHKDYDKTEEPSEEEPCEQSSQSSSLHS